MSIPENLVLKQMQVGPMDNFLYFLGDERSKEIAVVDPAWDVDYLNEQAKKSGYAITSIFLTHGHSDHVNGLDEILKTHNVPAYISEHEADFYTPNHKNLKKVNDGQKLKVGQIEFECILTPGHTPGCQCFKYENVLITGDTMFIDGCGRCDLPGGDAREMYSSLYETIMPMSDDMLIYPGHDYGPIPFSTLRDQKKTNPYLHCRSLEEFLQQRMGMAL